MDHYLLITYFGNPQTSLTTVKTRLLNPQDPVNYKNQQYQNVHLNQNFERMILSILHQVHTLASKFINLVLVASNALFFQTILSSYFLSRQINPPYSFSNFLPLKQTFYRHYGKICESIDEIRRSFQWVYERDELVTMQRILLRMRQDGYLCNRNCLLDEKLQYHESCHLKLVGLPYSVNREDIMRKIVCADNKYVQQLIFLHQCGKFTGNCLLKVQWKLGQIIQQRNGIYLGTRYIEIIQLETQQYEKYKLRFSMNYTNINQSRSRSYRKQNKKYLSSSSQSSSLSNNQLIITTGIKIRGLPFTYTILELERLFQKYHPITGNSKMGHRNGRKSGQAVILFALQNQAIRAMKLNRLVVLGRYLELKLCTMEEYERFS